jgi:hypothetical protein
MSRQPGESPTLDGRPTTWGKLADLTGLTRQGAKYKYERIARYTDRTQITTQQMLAPVDDPNDRARRAARAEEELRAQIAKFVFMHGPTHAAMEFNLPKHTVEEIAQAYKLRL